MNSLAPAGAILALALLAWLVRELWCHAYWPRRGRLYQSCGQAELAAAAWQCYLRCRTLSGQRRKLAARFALAECWFALGRVDEAAEQCEAVLATRPSASLAALANRLRADCLDHLGQSEQAAEARQAANSAPCDPTRDARYAKELEVRRLEAHGDWFGALRLLESLAADTLAAHELAEHLRLRLWLAGLRLRLGLYPEALTTTEGLLARSDLTTDSEHHARQISARAALCLERLPLAARDSQAAFRIAVLAGDQEKLADDQLLLAEVAMQQGDYVEAMRRLQYVRECGGRGLWMAGLGEAELLALWGRLPEAMRALDQAERRLPPLVPGGESPAMVVALARAALLADDDPAAALAAADRFVATPVLDPRLRCRRAAVLAPLLRAAGRDAEAAPLLDDLRRCREEFAHDRHLQVEIDVAEARLAWVAGDIRAAAGWYRVALDRPPFELLRPRLQQRLGGVLEASGDQAGALASYSTAASFPQELGATLAARRRLAELGAT